MSFFRRNRLLLSPLCLSIALPSAAFLRAQQPDEAGIIRGVDAAVKTRLDSIASYTVTEHYAVYRNNDETHPVSEMTVKTNYQRDTGKTYTILSQSGSAMIQKLVLNSILENEKRINEPGTRESSWLTSANYEMKLNPGGPQQVNGRDCYMLSINPRQKAPNRIEGTIWVDTRDESIVKLRGVAKTYARGGEEVRVLENLDLDVPAASYEALMGPSGSGKSTLLNLIAGLDRPSGGTITVSGKRIDSMSDSVVTP